MEERLQKILARAGYGSRRSCELLITAKRVRVNGTLAVLGSKADPARDVITVDGREIKVESPVYIALNKPRGVLSDAETGDTRQTVLDLVPESRHLFPVGRLDKDSEGLILLTNDGELANRLTHPRYEHEKEYRVLLAVRPDEEQLETWRRGVVMEDGHRTLPAEVEIESTYGKGAWVRVVLREGKKRQIREVGKLLGMPVVRLIRVRISGLTLGSLKPGEWRYLSPKEVEELESGKARPSPRRRLNRVSKPNERRPQPKPRQKGSPSPSPKPGRRGEANPRRNPPKKRNIS